MERRSCLSLVWAFSLLVNGFCLPADVYRLRRQSADAEISNDISESSSTTEDTSKASEPALTAEHDIPLEYPVNTNDDDDDDFGEAMQAAPASDGSNLFSLWRLVSAILPGSSSASVLLRNIIRQFLLRNQLPVLTPRQDIGDNEIEIDYIDSKNPLLKRQNTDEDNSSESVSVSNESDDDNAAEESVEEEANESKQDSDSNMASDGDDSDYDSDEPPGGGDGQGGGILGLLAGLSGGEDGQSDLGSLLAAVSSIVVNLSGDGIDVNSIIASGIGLFVGLLSEGEENPGTVIASYLLTSLDTITGGGAKNNGAFIGKFLSKLVKGTSAAGDPDASSEENGNGMKMADSAGFLASLLMSLLGDMSKGSSNSNAW